MKRSLLLMGGHEIRTGKFIAALLMLQSIFIAPAWSTDPVAADAETALAPYSPELEAQDQEADLCNQEPTTDQWPEKMQSGVHEFSCRTVRWLDSRFGDEEDFDEETVSGKLRIGMAWNQFDKFDSRMRYRVRSDLPNFSSRWDAFLGRVDEEAYISDTETVEARAVQQGIGDRQDPEWLLGLGYRDRKRSRDAWDYSIGIRLRAPPRLYIKARYRNQWDIGSRADLRYQQTFFWRDGIGYGTTSHIDTARTLANSDLLRWELLATLSEETDGVRWWTGNTWYHRESEEHGVSLLSFARGESDKHVPLQEYGFELTWRRRVAREWLRSWHLFAPGSRTICRATATLDE